MNISVLILCRMLIDSVLQLSKMRKRATWKRILESEEDKKTIAKIFKKIDERTKNFHVRPLHISTNQYFDAMFPAQTHANH